MMKDDLDASPEVNLLFDDLKKALPQLKILFDECNDHWIYEDSVYRFYHHSWKVYELQYTTKQIVTALHGIAPEHTLNEWFMAIIKEGTDKEFGPGDNERWLEATRPILEAFFHAKYFLEMAVKYGSELAYPPSSMPSGWAAILCLYNLRHV